jgi:hypothetical protein
MMTRVLLCLTATLVLSCPSLRANEAESIRVAQPTLSIPTDGGWIVDADVRVTLSPVLVDALKRGTPLYFIAELEVFKTRWYWFDKRMFDQVRMVRVSYHAITQQFRVALGGLHQSAHAVLDDALAAATTLRGWMLATDGDKRLSALASDLRASPADYEVRLRVKLDGSQLPKPLQINALTNRDWNLSSDWVRPRLMFESSSGTSP